MKYSQTQVLLRLLSYTKAYKQTLTMAFILLLLGTASQIVGPLLVKIFIDDYLTPRLLTPGPLILLGTAYITLYLLSFVFNYFQLLVFQKTALQIIEQLRIDVFSKVEKLGMPFFDKTTGGSLVSRMTNDTETIKELFVEVISTFIQSLFFLIGIFVAMFLLDRRLATFCLVLLPIIALIMQIYRKLSGKYYFAMREKLSDLNAKLSESIQGMAIIQVFRQEQRLRGEFSHINDQHFAAGMKNLKLDGLLLRPAIDLVYVFALIIILSYFGFASFTDSVSIGVLYAFVNYLDRFFEPVNQMMMRLSLFQQAIVSAVRLFQLMDEEEPRSEAKLASEPLIQDGAVEFKQVSFSYDGKTEVLSNISFKAKPGQTIALVGHTGSGKSSIINLFMRFYDTYQGDILIDGASLKHFRNNELRKKIGLVLQDPFIFVGDIKQNVRLYNQQISDEAVKEAAKFVQADTFIKNLPCQYDHPTGERGSALSSGQRQLLAFARTMVIKPKILILDEATANIDTETEELIQQALNKMRKGRTTIVIAHRLSTVQDADMILVLHQGKIVEQGNHQQLLASKGLYQKMYLLQQGKQEHSFEES